MASLTDAEIDAAAERGQIVRAHEPRAAAARYDRQLGHIVVDLIDGRTFAFAPRLAQGLESANEEELAQVEILGAGYGLHWAALDTDLSVPGLLAGVFGTQAFMARRAEQATSPKKVAAARNSDPRGGRP